MSEIKNGQTFLSHHDIGLEGRINALLPEPLDSVGWTVLGMYAVNASNVEVGASATAVGIHLPNKEIEQVNENLKTFVVLTSN